MRLPTLHTGPSISSHALNGLRRQVSGPIRSPDASQPTVLEVADVYDVVAAVRWAVTACVQVVVRPANPAAIGTRGALVLDLSRLDTIALDAERRVARLGAGTTMRALAAALEGTGLVPQGETAPGRTVIGPATTGGLGWLGRKVGLAGDSLMTVDVVDGVGALHRAGPQTDTELFWALRGGGPGLGIVVAAEVALHAVPSACIGALSWSLDAAPDMIRAFRRLCADAPDGLSASCEIRGRLPDVGRTGPGSSAGQGPAPTDGAPAISVAVVSVEEPTRTRDLLAPLRAVPGLATDSIAEQRPGTLPAHRHTPYDDVHGYRSELVTALDDELVERLVGIADTHPGGIQILQLGGALARVSTGAGCHGPIHEPFTVQVGAGLPPVAMDGSGPWTGRTLPAFRTDPGNDTWFDGPTRERLGSVKREVDPIDSIGTSRPV